MTYALQSRESSNSGQQSTAKTTVQTFTNERESTSLTSSLQKMVAHSPQQQKLNATAQMMANSSTQQRLNTIAQSFVNKPEPLQRVEDEASLQGKFEAELAQCKAVVEAPKPNNTGLPDNLKTGIESLSGMSMDHVKVHYNSPQPAQLNAHAYAQGSEIHLAPGQEQHLPHEAWHVVQQAQGRVKPTMQMKAGVSVNDDVGLDNEADVMGQVMLNREDQSSHDLNGHRIGNIGSSGAVQLVSDKSFTAQDITYHVGGGHYHQQQVGDHMEAWIDPLNPMQGSGPDAGIQGIYNRYGGFTKGHLLNARLGGEGAGYNLFPITPSMNAIHAGAESHVKWMVMNLGRQQTTGNELGRRVHYRVQTAGLPVGNQFTGAAHVRACSFNLQASYTDAMGVNDDPNAPGSLNTVVADHDGSVNEDLITEGYGLDPAAQAVAGYALAPLPGAPVFPAMTHNVMLGGVAVGTAAIP